jgi:peroxiredoxin
MRRELAIFLVLFLLCPWSSRVRCQEVPSLQRRFQDLREQYAATPAQPGDPTSRQFYVFAPRFLELAESSPTDPVARQALLWVVQAGFPLLDMFDYGESKPPSRQMGKALDLLKAHHSADEDVGMACLLLYRLPSPTREGFLRVIEHQSSSRAVKGRACYSLAKLLATKAVIAGNIQHPPANRSKMAPPDATLWGEAYCQELRQGDSKAMIAEAERLFERTIAEFGDVSYALAAPMTGPAQAYLGRNPGLGKTLGELATADLDEIRNLTVGKVAPEIEGHDAEGKVFKLSDYRGRVVVLTFSGNWCNPCRQMYPAERALVERLKGKPFALLSVNTDETVETLRRSIDSGEITWRCWWDGPDRPTCSRWNIRSFPTVTIIDQQGVIRHRMVNVLGLNEAVDALLAEIAATDPKSRE